MIRGSKLEEIMSIMYKVVEKIFDQISCGLGPLSSSLDGEISRKRNLVIGCSQICDRHKGPFLLLLCQHIFGLF